MAATKLGRSAVSQPLTHLAHQKQTRLWLAAYFFMAAVGALLAANPSPAQTSAPVAAAEKAQTVEKATAPNKSVAPATATIAQPATPLDASVGKDWVRVKNDEKNKNKPVAMQTAVVRYAGQAAGKGGDRHDVTVDLIGAVHVGDLAYYDALNKQFTQYDALLYELVAPPGTTPHQGRAPMSSHPVGIIQNLMKSALELDHQLEKIDYTKPNFVHADMSPAQFEQAMRDRNEGWLQMYFRLLGTAMGQQTDMSNAPTDFDILAAMFAKDRPRRLKILLAKQLAEMETLMISFGGEQGSAIITDRNKMALKVLKEQMDAGKVRLGVFYGAGHLQDMDERLRKDFQLKPVAINWLTAWNLAERP